MVSVEKASVQDACLFARLEQVADTKHYILPYSEAEHAHNILDPSFIYLRILEAEKLAGFFIFVLDTDQCSVEFRRVVVSEKDKGIGKLAIAAMEYFCRTNLKRTSIWLDVFECNNRGRHVYEKLGYERYGESEHQCGKLFLYQKRIK